MTPLEQVQALRTAGEREAWRDAADRLAKAQPDDVAVRIEAAWACDSHGEEDDAIVHYDTAWRLGVPEAERRGFLVGYGSTLRNVGRVEEAVALLGEAVDAHPDYPPLKAFLALALHSAGHTRAALALALDAALDTDQGRLDGYAPALAGCRDALLAEAVGD